MRTWFRIALGLADVCIAAPALLGLAACGEKSPVAKPTAPDMAPLVQSYEHPTLVLDGTNIQAAFDSSEVVGKSVKIAASLGTLVHGGVHSGVNADGDQQQIGASGDTSSQPLKVTGSGFLLVHRICPGPDPSKGPDAANGAMDLTVGFTEKGIDPVVWGTFSACQFTLNSAPATVGGALNLFVGDGLTFDAYGTQPVLFAFAGDLATSSGTGKLDVDVRLLPTGAYEYRVVVGDKHAIYWDDLTHRGFRAANGTWTCQFETKQCTKNDDGLQLGW